MIPKRSLLFGDFSFFAALALFFTSLATLQSATVPYFSDFESPVGPEWSSTVTDNSTTAVFSRFSGRFANETQSLTLTGLTPGESYTLSFDLYVIDSWDGDATTAGPDTLRVQLDGYPIFNHTFSNYNGNPPDQSQTFPRLPNVGREHLGFSTEWVDAIYRKISVSFTASNSTSTITFQGQNLEDENNETWGLDNVNVKAAPALPPIPQNGMTLWLTADSGVSADAVGNVSAWQDVNQNETASQPVSSARPIVVPGILNGKPVIRFDGSDDFLTLGTSPNLVSGNFTYFIVTFRSSWASMALLSRDEGPGDQNKWIYWFNGSPNQFHIQPGNEGLNSESFSPNYGRFEVLSISKDSLDFRHKKAGFPFGNATSTVDIPAINSDLRIGQAEDQFYLSGDIAEIIFYNRALTDSEIQQVELFLYQKYALDDFDPDSDGIPNSYEIANGLNGFSNDGILDKDGDGIPNQWEFANNTPANQAEDFSLGRENRFSYVVDPSRATLSTEDNIVETISEAISLVPSAEGSDLQYFKSIWVKAGEYPEKIEIPVDKRIALIGERGGQVKVLGESIADHVMTIAGKSVVDGIVITRSSSEITAGTVMGAGLYVADSPSNSVGRVVNCMILSHARGVDFAEFWEGAPAVLEYCTIAWNRNAGLFATYRDRISTVKNCIIWNPEAGNAGQFTSPESYEPDISGNIVLGGQFGGLNLDPMLTPDGFLIGGSYAVDAAVAGYENQTDIHGDVRPLGLERDMGADEFVDVDSDSDGLSDWWEMEWFTNLQQNGEGDFDEDGLANQIEKNIRSNPTLSDSDADGITDINEFTLGTNPSQNDTEGDGIWDGYEVANGLDPFSDDSVLDKDGDAIPNQWEFAKGTPSNQAEDYGSDWEQRFDFVVDQSRAELSASDNTVATIGEAVSAVPVAETSDPQYCKSIWIKGGNYAETVNLPVDKRIALIGQRGGQVKVLGETPSSYALILSGKSVVDGLVLTRDEIHVLAGTVTGAGLYVADSPSDSVGRVVNCMILGHARGVDFAEFWEGTPAILEYCTIAWNRNAGLFATYRDRIWTVKNCIIWNPDAGNEGQFTSPESYTPDLSGNIVFGGQFGGLNVNPILSSDGFIIEISSALDTGTSETEVLTDILGQLRPIGEGRDMGAAEYSHVDSDSDGLSDLLEMAWFGDLDETLTSDFDGDGLSNEVERNLGSNPSLQDTDQDGASDSIELSLGTNLLLKDSDADGMFDGYEIANSLNVFENDSVLDKDGDGIPNQWEFAKGTPSNQAEDFSNGWEGRFDFIIDPTQANLSQTDNILGTISEAVASVPVAENTSSQFCKSIWVKAGEYPETVNLPVDRQIALIGQRGGKVKILGASTSDYGLIISGKSVVDGIVLTRNTADILSGTVEGAGLYVADSPSEKKGRIVNCIILGHARGVDFAEFWSGAPAAVEYCTIAWNRNAGLFATYRDRISTVKNCIIWNPQAGIDNQFQGLEYYWSDLTENIVFGGQFGGLDLDPKLSASGNLNSNSMAIDSSATETLVNVDIHGDIRPQGTAKEMGADEYSDSDSDLFADSIEQELFGNLNQALETDFDEDGLSNGVELALGSNLTASDTDGDGASDGVEQNLGTNLFSADSENDGMLDGYEISNGLDPLFDDSVLDKDGDAIPNQWEFAKGTPLNLAEDFSSGWEGRFDFVVDPSKAELSSSDNILASIAEAVAAVPVAETSDSQYFKSIWIKAGEYAETVNLPLDKRIALVAQRGGQVKILGDTIDAYGLIISGKSVVDGVVLTRNASDISAGTVTGAGLYIADSPSESVGRLVNCMILGHARGVDFAEFWEGAPAALDYCTIAWNRNAGFYANYRDRISSVKNCIIWNPEAGSDNQFASPNFVYFEPDLSGNIVFAGQFGGLGLDPKLNSTGFLNPDSMAINSSAIGNAVNSDIHGDTRPQGTAREMGADEYVDSDLDGLPDWWEQNWFFTLIDSEQTNDNDGLTLAEEFLHGTNPTLSDTDDDGALDGVEVAAGTSPFIQDSDFDGMQDGYELANSLDPFFDDSALDKDGDAIPNQWEFAKGTSSNQAEDFSSGWEGRFDFVVDPSKSELSSSDNIVATVVEAVSAVPMAATSDSQYFKSIWIKDGEYVETVNLPSEKRIALVAQRGGRVKILGETASAYGLIISGKSVVDGVVFTRSATDILAGTVAGAGVYVADSPVESRGRIVNCIILGHARGVDFAEFWSGAPAAVEYCTIAWNRNAGLYATYRDRISSVKNCIIWNPEAGMAHQFGSSEYFEPDLSGNIVFEGQFGGLNLDPDLNSAGYLKADSNAINSSATGNAVYSDIHGDTRPQGAGREMGADEYSDNDSDLDGLPDVWETTWFGDLQQTSDSDFDDDGLKNKEEFERGGIPVISDSDQDGIRDGEEVENGLDLNFDDSTLDKDGDGIPNLWEIAKGTPANVAEDFASGWEDRFDFVVDSSRASLSSTDNIFETITEAVAAVPVAGGSSLQFFKSIWIKDGDYVETVILPADKRIALIAKRGGNVKILGETTSAYGLIISGKSVVDGIVLTRHAIDIFAKTVTGAGIYVADSPSENGGRIVNCIILGHARGVDFAEFWSGIPASIEYCTIAWNQNAGLNALYRNRISSVKNCIIWNPFAGADNQFLSENWWYYFEPDLSGNIVYAGQFGGIDSNPLLNPDGFLQTGSLAIDTAALGTTVNVDIHGDARPRGLARDMGADEYVDSDLDGLPDWWEQKWFFTLIDSEQTNDNDGLTMTEELLHGTNPTLSDTDADGALDGAEVAAGTSPFVQDSDFDGMSDGYELADDLNAFADDTLLDKDGDGIPNQWEYAKNTPANQAENFSGAWQERFDYVVDPSESAQSGTDNIVGTIGQAIALVPVAVDSTSQYCKSIFVTAGEYSESVVIPANKRIALIGARGGNTRLTGGNVNLPVVRLEGRAVVEGFVVSRQQAAVQAGSVTASGIYLYNYGYKSRVANCVVINQGQYGIHNDANPFGNWNGGNVDIESCTSHGNKVAALFSYVANRVVVNNSILWGNGASVGFGYAQNYYGFPNLSGSIVKGGVHGGQGSDPLLSVEGLLTHDSSAINASVGGGEILVDIHGEPRQAGGVGDVGADEYVDSDTDGVPDWWEARWFSGLSESEQLDDANGLNLAQEFLNGTNPTLSDSDGDGLTDGQEVLEFGLNPNYSETITVAPDVTVPPGFFNEPVNVGFTSTAPLVQYRYTIDGTEPNASSALADAGVVNLLGSSSLRVKGYRGTFAVTPASGVKRYVIKPEATFPVEGVTLWMKAGEAVQIDASSNVVSWSDLSENRPNAVPPGSPASAKPVLLEGALPDGSPSVRFNGSNQYLSMPAGADFHSANGTMTAFVYGKWEGGSGLGPFVVTAKSTSWTDGGWGLGRLNTGGSDRLGFWANSYSGQSTFADVPSGGYQLLSGIRDASQIQFLVNGQPVGNSTVSGNITSSGSGLFFGGYPASNRFLNGDIAEVLVYDRALSSSELIQVHEYFEEKYGTTVVRPSANPPSGIYDGQVNITLSSLTPGAAIYYTLDGSEPTTGSSLANGTISITQSGQTLLKARAFLDSSIPSTVFSGVYTIDDAAPVVSDAKFNATALTPGLSLGAAGTLSVVASDASAINRVEFYVDGQLLAAPSAPVSGRYQALWNISGTTPDGNHEVKILAFDQFGKVTETIYPVSLTLARPGAPVLTAPANNTQVATSSVLVQGTATVGSTVTVLRDNVTVASGVPVNASGQFQATVPLQTGNQTLTATAAFRSGEPGPVSAGLTVQRDETVPEAPLSLSATAESGGRIRLEWVASPSTNVAGYRVYRSAAPFEEIGSLQPLNATLLNSLSLVDNSAASGSANYYRVVPVSGAGVVGNLSNLASATSDGIAPSASAVWSTVDAPFDPTSQSFGIGKIQVVLTATEQLRSLPFLSLKPQGGLPVPITLTQDASNPRVFRGEYIISAQTPAGEASLSFVAHDTSGNRGTMLDLGATVILDNTPPAVVVANLPSVIKNSTATPALIPIEVELDEPAALTPPPVLTYTLSDSQPAVQTLPLTEVPGSNRLRWTASIQLLATAGNNTEDLTLGLLATDDLANSGGSFAVPSTALVYQGVLPGLLPPPLNATSAPGGAVILTWGAVENATEYLLYSGTSADPESLTLLATKQGNEFTSTDVPATDGTYFYAIAARRTVNEEPSAIILSNPPVQALSDRVPPAAPTNLLLELTGQGISATWTAPLPQEPLTYQLLRSATLPLTLESEIVRNAISGNQTLDSSPTSAKTHYAVVALDAVGNRSQPSAPDTNNADLFPPATLTITADLAGAHPVRIDWTQSGTAHSGHRLFVGETDPAELLGSVPAGTNSFTDSAYTGTSRRYVIATMDSQNTSSPLKSLRLPGATVSMEPGQRIGRGIINRLKFTVTNTSSEPSGTIANAVLMATVGGNTYSSASLLIPAGASVPAEIYVPGTDTITGTSASLDLALQVEPTPGTKALLTMPVTLPVIDQAIPVTLQVHDLLRGGNGKASFTIQNPGTENLEIVLSKNNSAIDSPDVRFVMESRTGDPVSVVPVRIGYGDSVHSLAGGDVVLRIPPGATVTSPEFTIPVPSSAPADVVFSLEIDRMWTNYGTTAPTELDIPITRSVDVSTLPAPYTARIQTITPATSFGNEPIVISGNTTLQGGVGVAVSQPVTIAISREGFVQTLEATTAPDGTFTVPFVLPSGSPGGTFSVWAYHPEQTNFSPTTTEIRTFVIRRVSASPAEINWAAPRNFEQAFTFQLSAVGGNATNVRAEIHAADQDGAQLPAGITSNSTTVPILSGTGNLTLKLKTDNSTPSSGRLIVRMVSEETAPLGFQSIGINYSLRDATPVIVATPSSLSTGKNIGVALSDKITITNQGLAPLMDASWQILNNDPQGSPAPSWVSQVTPALLGNLAPGSSIDLRIDFASTAPQADYVFKIVIRSSNSGPIDFPIHLAVTPAEVGTFSVRVIDLNTGGTVNGGLVGGVQNARVRLQSTVNPSTVFNAVTDTNGQIGLNGTGLSEIPVGLYDLTITSDQHQPYRTSLWIRPGATTMEQAVLQFETVNVTWEVVETTIRDTYEVLATINFATDVPVPVIVATPAAINLPPMETGSVFNGEIAFKNHGAISPDNAKFKLPPGDANFQYEFAPNAYVTPSASDPSTYELTLPPGQTVRVPYKITALRKFEGCTYSTFFNGESITLCPNGTIHRQSFSFGVFASGPNCPQSQPPTPAQYISSGSGSSTSAPTGWKPAPLATTDDCFDPVYQIKNPNGCVDQKGGSSDIGDSTGGGTQGSNSGAVQPSSSSVDLINREYMDGREDLTVAVPGGSLILRRDFYRNQWHFSHDRSLTFVNAADNSGTATVLRNRVAYAARDAARTVFASDKFTITKQQLTPGVITWRWASPNGQWERYDTNGRLLETGFREHTLMVLHYPTGSATPTELRDVNGRTIITLDYQAGKLTNATDLAGRTVSYLWQNNRLTTFTDAEGQPITMTYDSAGRMTSKVDRNNQTITINYTPAGFVSAVLGGTEGDQQFAFSFNTSTRTHYARVTFGTDRVVESWYDRDGELIKQSENGVTQVTRTRSGSTITEVDALGRTTRREYDSFDNLIRQVNPDGRTATWEYEPVYQQIRRHVDLRGVVTTYEYFTTTHRLKEVIRGQGTSLAQTSFYIWDTAGRLDQVTDPLGMKTKFTYDPVKDLPLTITRGYETPEAQVTTMTYDAVGNLDTLSNSLNQTSEFEHDDLRRLRKITNPLNEISTFTYNGTRLTKAETGAIGTTPGRGLRKVYDARGRVTAEYQIGANGAELLVRAMSHDSEGRVLAVTNALGQTVESFTYDAFGRRTSRSVPNTNGGQATATTEYDNLDRITATFSPEGIHSKFQYDTGDRILKITEAVDTDEERVTDMVYNAIGDLSEERFPTANGTLVRISKFDALGRLTEISGARTEDFAYAYDAGDNLLTSTDGRGNTTSLTYDILGRLKNRTLPAVPGSPNSVTTFTYDQADNMLSEQDGDGRTTGFAYDALNRRLAQSIPVQGSLPATWATNDALVAQRMTYNSFGEVTATWAPASAVASAATATINQTTFGYDAFGRATSRVVNTAPGKTLTSITAYSIVGQPLTSTTTSTDTTAPQTTRWEYDPANPVIVSTVTDPTGFQIAYDYDNANRVETATRSTGASEVWTYDGLSRIKTHTLSATDAITQHSSFTYNRFDQLLTHTQPGHTTENPKVATRSYDNKGRLATEGGSASYALTYGYDDSGNLNFLKDANNSVTEWTYDARNRLAEKKYADNKIWNFTHDAEGNLLTRKDARNQTITYAYNAFGRVTNIDYPNDADVTFGYDAAGRLTSLSDATGTSTWTPDPWDRTVAASQPLVSRALSVSYNDRGQRATAGLIGASQNNRSITYHYDSLSRLQTLTDTVIGGPVTGGTFVYSYEPGTRWVSRVESPSGSATVQTRDDLGRVLSTSFRGEGDQVLNSFAYTYDAAGQREAETGPRGEVDFDYNGIGELTGAEGLSGGNYTYQYDGIGNRLVSQIPGVLTAYEPNAVNQYTEITQNSQTPVVPLYDLNGNMVSDGKGTSYSYDQENRLVGIQSTTSNKQSVFLYDGLSRRVETRELENGTLTKTIRYVYDGLVPVEEFEWSGAATGSSSKVRQITRGIDASGTLQGAGGIGGLLAFTTNGASAWYFADANGNVANLFTASDTASATYTYDPFGRRLTASGPLGTVNAYQWSGKEYHEASGLVYYLYRFYDPETGRWLNRDPLQEEGGANLYAFVFNDPTNLVDPDGRAVDVLLDIGFIAWDIFNIITDPCNRGEHLKSLGLNVLGALIPGITGLGAAYKAAKYANRIDNAADIAKFGAETIEALAKGADGAAELALKNADEAAQQAAIHADEAAGIANKAPPIPGLCFLAGTPIATASGSKSIESLRLGQRVLTTDDSSSTEIDTHTWKQIKLHMPNPAHPADIVELDVLRSPEWMAATGSIAGAKIWFEMEEMGLHGWADVVDISPCPQIEGGPGRVVLATVTHLNSFVMDIDLEGNGPNLNPTDRHRLYSLTRNDWIPAGRLEVGEELRTQEGPVRIAAISMLPGTHRVYNLEVETDHCYFAGHDRVLSHNTNPCAAPTLPDSTNRRINVGESGHHVPAVRKAKGRDGLEVSRSDKSRPTLHPSGKDPAHDHWRMHDAERQHVGPRQGDFDGTDDELFDAYRRSYEGLDDIKVDVRSPDGLINLGTGVTPRKAVDLINYHLRGGG